MITTEKLPNGHEISVEWDKVNEDIDGQLEGWGCDENGVWHEYEGYTFINEADEDEVDLVRYVGPDIPELNKHGLRVQGKLKF